MWHLNLLLIPLLFPFPPSCALIEILCNLSHCCSEQQEHVEEFIQCSRGVLKQRRRFDVSSSPRWTKTLPPQSREVDGAALSWGEHLHARSCFSVSLQSTVRTRDRSWYWEQWLFVLLLISASNVRLSPSANRLAPSLTNPHTHTHICTHTHTYLKSPHLPSQLPWTQKHRT